jgi:hypothetical protein
VPLDRTPPKSPRPGLTVAVTGPTGDIGRSLMRALERSRETLQGIVDAARSERLIR